MNTRKQNIFSEILKGIQGWPVILHLSKSRETRGKCHNPSSDPSHSINEFKNGMELRMGNGISPIFVCFFER